ncbi:MAG: hypothetical protein HRU40_20565, partial [Saprospiraceae bacterium]|nr:hypothetical protein [Saprospiraceae bacterium]
MIELEAMNMRSYLTIVFLFFFFSLTAKKTTIEITVLAEESMELNFYPTMDGYFFSGAAKKLTINPGRTLTLSFDSEAPGLSYLHFSNWVFPGTGGGFTVFTNPGDVVRIAFGKTNPRETFKISGNNLAVNQ